MTDTTTPAHDTDDAHAIHSHGSTKLYVTIAICLVFLTACSYWTDTRFWPFGESIAIKRLWMMAVSCTKAMLVIMFFMHLKWEANWKWVLTIPASLMAALLIFALVPDVGWRMRHASYTRMQYAAERPSLEDEQPSKAKQEEYKYEKYDE